MGQGSTQSCSVMRVRGSSLSGIHHRCAFELTEIVCISFCPSDLLSNLVCDDPQSCVKPVALGVQSMLTHVCSFCAFTAGV